MIIIQEKVPTTGTIPFCICLPQLKEVCQCQLYSSIWVEELNDGSGNSYLSYCIICFKAYDGIQSLVIDYDGEFDDKIKFAAYDPDTKTFINYHKMNKQVFPNTKSLLEEIIDEGRRSWQLKAFS